LLDDPLRAQLRLSLVALELRGLELQRSHETAVLQHLAGVGKHDVV
jgi:hypothetical protein